MLHPKKAEARKLVFNLAFIIKQWAGVNMRALFFNFEDLDFGTCFPK